MSSVGLVAPFHIATLDKLFTPVRILSPTLWLGNMQSWRWYEACALLLFVLIFFSVLPRASLSITSGQSVCLSYMACLLLIICKVFTNQPAVNMHVLLVFFRNCSSNIYSVVLPQTMLCLW